MELDAPNSPFRNEPASEGDIKTKRLCCGWDHNYLLKVLTGGI